MKGEKNNEHNTIQYNTIQYNTIQYNTIQSINSDKKFLLIFKRGKFFIVYDDDAFVFHYLFGYRLTSKDTTGFPETELTKITNTLDDKKISYQVIYKDKDPIVKDYSNLDNYNKILIKSIEYLEMETKIESLKKQIDEIDNYELLCQIVEVINNELQGR